MNNNQNQIPLCEITGIFLVIVMKLITYFFMVFLINLKLGLYPYADIGGFYTYAVDTDALLVRIFFSFLGFISGALSSCISLWGFRECRYTKTLKLIFMILMMTSVIETLFCGYRFLELRNLSSSLVNCDNFSGNSLGCYIP